MSKLFMLLAVLLIASGILLLAVPKEPAVEASARSLAPETIAVVGLAAQARQIAETLNAPLSIVFGLASLFYSRRSYQVNKARAEATVDPQTKH